MEAAAGESISTMESLSKYKSCNRKMCLKCLCPNFVDSVGNHRQWKWGGGELSVSKSRGGTVPA